VVCADTNVPGIIADRTKTEASKYDFIFVRCLIDDGDSFHFENGGWEVLMKTESPVKPKADTARVTRASDQFPLFNFCFQLSEFQLFQTLALSEFTRRCRHAEFNALIFF
jgi:hypothetical protein